MLTERKSTVSDLFHSARQSLLAIYNYNEATQLVSILFEHYAGLTRKDMIIDPERKVNDQLELNINHALERLLKHEPVQYITGFAHFCGNEFRVSPDVLIPRPETEELVRWVLDQNHDKHHLRILDIGTGSGCIAITLWLRFQDAMVEAWDISEKALEVAITNNLELRADVIFRKVNFLDSNEWPDEEYDIVISNPPYIPYSGKGILPLNVALYEPGNALFIPDNDPLIFYRKLSEFAQQKLKSGASVYAEMHEDYAEDVGKLFEDQKFSEIEIRNDINGKRRMIRAKYSK